MVSISGGRISVCCDVPRRACVARWHASRQPGVQALPVWDRQRGSPPRSDGERGRAASSCARPERGCDGERARRRAARGCPSASLRSAARAPAEGSRRLRPRPSGRASAGSWRETPARSPGPGCSTASACLRKQWPSSSRSTSAPARSASVAGADEAPSGWSRGVIRTKGSRATISDSRSPTSASSASRAASSRPSSSRRTRTSVFSSIQPAVKRGNLRCSGPATRGRR